MKCLTNYLKDKTFQYNIFEYASNYDPEYLEEFYHESNLKQACQEFLECILFKDDELFITRPLDSIICNHDHNVRSQLEAENKINQPQCHCEEVNSEDTLDNAIKEEILKKATKQIYSEDLDKAL